MSSYYELLGVLEIVDDSGIQQAFHQFSQSFHPDLHRHLEADLRQAVKKIYQRGAEAYTVLRKPEQRAAYDEVLARGQLRLNLGGQPQVASEQGLDRFARSPAARLHARQIERALLNRDWQLAERLLDKALLADGLNPELEERGQQLIEWSKSRANQAPG